MCGISGVELLVIVVAAIIFLGPDKLPELLRMAGRLTRDLRKMKGNLDTVTREFRETVSTDNVRKQLEGELQLDRARQRVRDTENEIDALRSRLKDAVDPKSSGPTGASPSPSPAPALPEVRPALGAVSVDEPLESPAPVNSPDAVAPAEAPPIVGEGSATDNPESRDV